MTTALNESKWNAYVVESAGVIPESGTDVVGGGPGSEALFSPIILNKGVRMRST